MRGVEGEAAAELVKAPVRVREAQMIRREHDLRMGGIVDVLVRPLGKGGRSRKGGSENKRYGPLHDAFFFSSCWRARVFSSQWILNFPARKSGSWIMRSCRGMLVWMPSM